MSFLLGKAGVERGTLPGLIFFQTVADFLQNVVARTRVFTERKEGNRQAVGEKETEEDSKDRDIWTDRLIEDRG